jgi:chitinase
LNSNRHRSLGIVMILTAAALLACASIGPTAPPTGVASVTTAPTAQITPSTPAPAETAAAPTGQPSARILAGYYPGWAADRYPVSAIPADRLTHLLYAFANVSAGGDCISGNPDQDAANWQALHALKQQHPQLKLLISVGGWSQSALFSDVAATLQARARFAESCAAFVKAHGFDGLDVDWEFPVSGGLPTNHVQPEDGPNFTALLSELRQALAAQGQADGRRYLLTIAAPAGPGEYAHLELRLIQSYLDWINLMTYDFYTAESPTTNFNAPLYSLSTDPAPEARRRSHNAIMPMPLFKPTWQPVCRPANWCWARRFMGAAGRACPRPMTGSTSPTPARPTAPSPTTACSATATW